MYGKCLSRNLREEKGLDGSACAKVWHRDAICNSRGSPYSPSLSENLNDISAIVFSPKRCLEHDNKYTRPPFKRFRLFLTFKKTIFNMLGDFLGKYAQYRCRFVTKIVQVLSTT